LNFDKVKITHSFDGMFHAFSDVGDVAAADVSGMAIEDKVAGAINDGPYFVTDVVGLIADLFAGLDVHVLCQGKTVVTVGGVIENLVFAPAAFFVHGALLDVVDKWLEVGTLVFVGDEDAIRAGGDDEVLRTKDGYGDVEFVDHVGVFARVSHDHFANRCIVHHLGQGIPGAKVFPDTIVLDHDDGGFLLDDRIVKADFGQLAILAVDVGIGLNLEVLTDDAHQVAELEGKDTAVPEGALLDQLGSQFLSWFLLESVNPAVCDRTYLADAIGDDVAIFGRGVGWADTHQGHVGQVGLDDSFHLLQGLKIVQLGEGIDGQDDNDFVRGHLLLKGQVAAGEGDRREGVAAFGLLHDVHIVTELALDRIDLGLACSHNDVGIDPSRADLAVDPLDHRFIFLLVIFQKAQKLLGAGLIRKRPESFPGAAGK